MIDENIIDAFHLMWDGFPDPVVLIHKSREIVAANIAARANDRVEGIKCSTLFTPEAHKGCKANLALKNGSAEFLRKKGGTGELLLYWLPIKDNPEYLIHVSIGAVTKYE